MSAPGTAGSVVILGGSVAGGAAALLLSRAGWQVTLVDPEFDRMVSPGDEVTHRPGAPHTVHAHGFGSRAHVELRRRLPDVHQALVEAGAHQVPLSEMVPPALYDGGRPGDEDVMSLQLRRYTFDRVLATAVTGSTVARVPHRATGLVLDRDGSVPVVRGLQLADGTVAIADITIDAGGRRSPVSGWLAAAGIAQPERFDECVARYYTRHFQITGPRPPLNIGFADVHAFTCHVQLMFLGDGDTAMVAMAAHDEDPVLKVLRRPEAFDALLAANDAFSDWRAALAPTTGVFCLGAFDNRVRSLVEESHPVALGLHQVGDSLAMTNPTRGRGVGMGLMSAGAMVDVVTACGSPDEQTLAFEEWRSRVLLTYYRECALTDSIASDQMRAGLAGRSIPANAPQFELPDGHPISADDLKRAADHDPDLFRVLLRASVMLDDERHVASDDVVPRVRRVLETAPPEPPPRVRPTDGLHDRRTVEQLLASYA